MSIQSVEKALDILMLLHRQGKEMGISEMSREIGLHKSTIHRILQTLEQKEFVRQNLETEKYWLGLRVYSLGMAFGEKYSLRKMLLPFAEDLNREFNEVVNVSVWTLDERNNPCSLMILKAEGDSQKLRISPAVGSINQCNRSAVGKCLFAFGHLHELDDLIKEDMTRYTEHTICSKEAFRAHLEMVREQGYALDQEEQEVGLTCIGAPILDKDSVAIAAISLSGPTQRMVDKDFPYRIRRVQETAAKISEMLR